MYLKAQEAQSYIILYDTVFSQERYRETDLQLCHYAELFRRRGTEIFVYELFR
jgi:hypothetical protein